MTQSAGANSIRLLALDVDGVLTDGSIMLDDNGVETKRFNVRDGQGITAWIKMGFDVAIITPPWCWLQLPRQMLQVVVADG